LKVKGELAEATRAAELRQSWAMTGYDSGISLAAISRAASLPEQGAVIPNHDP